MAVPIIDIFAGPGGLGEGFSRLKGKDHQPTFKIRLSIETNTFAHRTLELRAFYRQFKNGKVPEDYYQYLSGQIRRNELETRFEAEFNSAREEAWQATLGKTKAEEVSNRIRSALGSERGNWLLIGGPPCQAYSLVGRSRMIGEIGRKEFEKDHRHFLYREYLRIIAMHQPAVFVMENVKGLLSAKHGDQAMFPLILKDLEDPLRVFPDIAKVQNKKLSYKLYSLVVPSDPNREYRPTDFIVRAEKYGVPQARHRLIIVGISDRVNGTPGLLTEQAETTVEDAIDDLPSLRSGLSQELDSDSAWHEAVTSIRQASWLYTPQVDANVRRQIKMRLSQVPSNLRRGSDSAQPSLGALRLHNEWFRADKYSSVCNHTTRSHIRADLHRYFFLAAFAQVNGRSPLLEEFPKELLPKHKNVGAALKETKFNDRFRVQVANRPSTTVVSHISKDGHYYIHPDPSQCRSLTVREAARLQTFPDNYFFEGPRTQQYHQVGNAVPPYLAHQIAAIIAKLF